MSFVVPSVIHNRGVKRPAPGASRTPAVPPTSNGPMVKTTGPASNGVKSTGPASNGVKSTGPERPASNGVKSTGPASNGVKTTGPASNGNKATGPTNNAVKKKKSTRVAKTDALTEEVHSLWMEDIEDTNKLLELTLILKDNLILGGGRDVKEDIKLRREMTKDERLSHWRALMDRITVIYDRKYDRLIRHDCGMAGQEASSITQLTYIATALLEKHKEDPIEPNWIRWALSKLLLSLTGKIVFDKMGGHISNHMLQLLQLLADNKEETSDLLETAIDQMHALTRKSQSITFTRATAPPELRVEIPMESMNGCETVIILTVVDLLVIHPFFDFPSLSAKSQLQLWAVLFHLAQNRRSQSAQFSAVQLMHRLLVHELASVEIVRVVVDYGVILLKAYPPARKENDKTVNLRDSVVTIMKMLTDHLRKLGKSRLLKGMQASVLINWACSVLELVQTWNLDSVEAEKRSALNAHRNILRTFSIICCRVISSIRVQAAEYLKEPLKQLEQAIKRLITELLRECGLSTPTLRAGTSPAAAAAAAEEMMACAAKLLLFADDLNGNEENSLWISKMTDTTLAACSDREEAALRARHLLISSLAPKHRPMRTSGNEEQLSQNASKATTTASAITPSTTALLQRLLPDNNQIMEHISSVDSLPIDRGIAVLQALFSLVAQMIPLSQPMTATAVAVLSLPWIATEADIVLACKAQYRSLPLLKEMYQRKLHVVVKKACTASSLLRECTLAPLSSLPRPAVFCDWRRKIYEKALTLNPSKSAPSLESLSIVKSALDSLAQFVGSVKPEAYERTISLVVELVDIDDLERSPVHIEHVVRAVADSLCALDGVSRRFVEATGEYRCTACDRLLSGGVPNAQPVSMPKEFANLMIKVFRDNSIRQNTIENRIDSYSILFAMLCHVQDAVKRFEEVIIASLPLITDKDEEVRKEYEWTFKVIVSMNPSEKLVNEIMNAFEIDNNDAADSPEEEQRIYESSAPFLAHCAKEGHDDKFRQWSREKMYVRALQFPSSSYLTELAHQLHISEAKKEEEIGEDPKRFFIRQTRTLAKMLYTELFSVVIDAEKEKEQNEAAEWTRWVNQECDYVLQTAATIWGFDSIMSLLRACASHLVAECFVVDPVVHGAALLVIERVRMHLDRDRRTLIEECVPAIVERIITAYDASQSATKLARDCGVSMRDLLDRRRYHCTLFVLRMMAVNEDKARTLLLTINRLEKDASITDLLRIRCEYLGYLLSLRRSLFEDDCYEQRGMILKSIRVIISLLDDGFLDEIASKLMMVLRAASAVGEGAIEVWSTFVERLGNDVLVSLLPQILIAVQPLLRFESSSGLLKTIFEQREALLNEQSASFERAVMVLLGGEGSFDDDDGSRRIRKYLTKRRAPQPTIEDVIHGCALMLREEGETVGRVVLRRLESTLDGRPLRDDLAADVMPALLHTIRVCADADVRLAAAKCIGMVGAVDPGRLGLSLEVQRREGKGDESEIGGGGQKKIVFINSSNHDFYVDLLVRAWRVYISLNDADMIDIASFAIQSLLSKLVGTQDDNMIFFRLPDECKRDIGPFTKTSLTNNNELKIMEARGVALVRTVSTFPDWLLQNFLVGMIEIKNAELHDIFKALKWLVYTRDTSFARHLLPHLIIIMVIERRETMIEHYCLEMIEVLRRTIEPQSPNWTRLAAHVVFSILDTLERYAIMKSEAGKKDTDHERVMDLIKRICSEKLRDGSLLVVVAAEKCQCLLRALRWCEQFAIGGGVTGFGPSSESEGFDRAPFYDLERLYMQLNEVDGVAGAFETIARNTSPTADERILALEANGDYTEALPLYAYSGEQKELKLLESLLRLNQPQLALSRAAMEQRGSVRDASTARSIEATQLEAAWHLRDWGRLDEMIKKRDPLNSGETGWGAACASIMNTIHHRKENEITVKTDRARSNLVERLTALTIEDSDTYAQSYKYIAQLHMLAEIDDAKVQLLSESQVSKDHVDNIMKYWEERSDCVSQCASTIEPMLRVRRELLRASGGERCEATKEGVSGLLLQSCRLARQADHLQIAWTFLVEAKALETCHQAVGMEEARFEFQKGNQSEAIGLLTRLLNVRFSKIHEIFGVFAKQGQSAASKEPIALATQTSVSTPSTAKSTLSLDESKLPARTLMAQQMRDERAAYAEVQLLRTEYMLKGGASSPQDLYQTYLGLKLLDVPSEDLHYRVAVFLDSLHNMAEIRTDLIIHILHSYGQVLQYGRSHLFHAVPRVFTVWLDVTQKLAEEANSFSPTSAEHEKRVKDIKVLNNSMRNALEPVPLSVLFPAFPQLISRILHPDQSVFEELSSLLARLIVAFPHQCLWQAIAVYRDTPEPTKEKGMTRDQMDEALKKMEMCKKVFERAKVMDKQKVLDGLIDQYDFFAYQLINIACNDNCRGDPEKLISKHFKPLHNFFKEKKMDTRLLLGAHFRKLVGIRTVVPHIMIPMTEMLEQSISEKDDVKLSTFSQFNVLDSPLSATARESPIVEAVYIQDVIDQFVMMSSLMAPRKISMRGTDGKVYSILCKKKDELRKDARVISFCKMMNCLMRRTPEARRRQLMVRTFSAIPLQAKGGIIEWVPNLNTFKETLNPLFKEYRDPKLPKDRQWNDKWTAEHKLMVMREHFYKEYPQVAAEWQRRAFSDPCSWHTARLLFTRSCAVMSMIGFVCGLGDRHADNILIDQSDGGIMHVDFNILFNQGEKLAVPEVVPFRLTRNVVDGFGPTGAEGTWRKSAEATLEVMRANADTLLTVMQAFIYDPLIEFGEARAQQNKTGQRKVEERGKSMTMVNEVLEMIKNRLEGHIVTPRTMKKLSLTKKMSVSGQVAKLYELATDETLISQMFSGWSPYL